MAWTVFQIYALLGWVVFCILVGWSIVICLLLEAVWIAVSILVWMLYLEEKDRTLGTIDKLFQRRCDEEE